LGEFDARLRGCGEQQCVDGRVIGDGLEHARCVLRLQTAQCLRDGRCLCGYHVDSLVLLCAVIAQTLHGLVALTTETLVRLLHSETS